MKYAPGGDVNWLLRGEWRGFGAVIYGRKARQAQMALTIELQAA